MIPILFPIADRFHARFPFLLSGTGFTASRRRRQRIPTGEEEEAEAEAAAGTAAAVAAPAPPIGLSQHRRSPQSAASLATTAFSSSLRRPRDRRRRRQQQQTGLSSRQRAAESRRQVLPRRRRRIKQREQEPVGGPVNSCGGDGHDAPLRPRERHSLHLRLALLPPSPQGGRHRDQRRRPEEDPRVGLGLGRVQETGRPRGPPAAERPSRVRFLLVATLDVS